MIIATATTKHIMPKAVFKYFCDKCGLNKLAAPIPTTLPAANGKATLKSRCPTEKLAATLVKDTKEITAKDVAITD